MNTKKSNLNIGESEFVLAAMSPANGAEYSPVQIQKLLFVLDRELGEDIGGPYFNFVAYDYGPFDKRVYTVLEDLAVLDKVTITDSGQKYSYYALTPTGLITGKKSIQQLDHKTQNYIVALSSFVRKCTFSQLVSAIYKAYPEMRENSVFYKK